MFSELVSGLGINHANIAAITSEDRKALGIMSHPEFQVTLIKTKKITASFF